MDTRALKNHYPDYDGRTQSLFDSQGKLTSEFSQQLTSKIEELLAVMESGLKSADPRNCTSYTGWAGIALLYLHLHRVFKQETFLQKAVEHVSRSLKCLTRRDVTFLCGDAGPLAVAAVVYHRLQRAGEADECITRLLQYHQTVVKGSSGLPDELLYGRVGYLYSLIFINQQLGTNRIPLQHIQQISEAILASGEHQSRKLRVHNQSPLMYEWYQEQYVGAAHGLAGIYYFLMQGSLRLRRTFTDWSNPASTMSAVLSSPLEITLPASGMIATCWCTGATDPRVSSICSCRHTVCLVILIIWRMLCSVARLCGGGACCRKATGCVMARLGMLTHSWLCTVKHGTPSTFTEPACLQIGASTMAHTAAGHQTRPSHFLKAWQVPSTFWPTFCSQHKHAFQPSRCEALDHKPAARSLMFITPSSISLLYPLHCPSNKSSDSSHNFCVVVLVLQHKNTTGWKQ
ncbi:glutathione S-transferase LANCL1 isoform X2 [Nerophis lumbriciformis]|nr:glutathione S-transferase LANCL1 isoform X2 [Nerophis lumbriciformis]